MSKFLGQWKTLLQTQILEMKKLTKTLFYK
jgi:hypothetical protein